MNIKFFSTFFLVLVLLMTSFLFFGSVYLNSKISNLAYTVFYEVLSKEADALVAVTRNDFLVGNTKLAKSVLEKAINRSGISKIDVRTSDGKFVESIGEISEDGILFTFDKDLNFSSSDQSAKWGWYTFYIGNHQFQGFANQLIRLQMFSVVPLLFIFCLILLFLFSYIGYSSLNLNRFIRDNSDQLSYAKRSEKIIWGDLIHKILQAKAELIQTTNEKHRLEKLASFAELSRKVAHDIRSPLSVLNIALGNIKIDDERIDLARQAIQRISEISADLLVQGKKTDYLTALAARSTDAGLQIEITSFDLSKSILAIVKEKQALANRRKIVFSIPNETFFAKGDRIEFERLLSNILQNAIDATEDKENSEIEVAIVSSSSFISVGVSDNGKGIPEEVLAKLNNQISVSFDKADGNGMGVFSARATILGWGGEFQIVSKVGVGTLVQFRLPR